MAVGTVAMDYDKNSNLTLLTDSNGKTTRWDYNPRDQLARKTYQDNTYEAYTYHCGVTSTVRGTRGQIINFANYFNGLPKFVNYPNTKDVAYFYNKLNDPIQINVGGEVAPLINRYYPDPDITRFTYDNYGRLLTNDGPLVGDTQTYAYDELQRIKTQAIQQDDSRVHSQGYEYDGLGRLKSINSTGTNSTGRTNYSYYGDSDRLFELTHPNGTKTRQQYDVLGRLVHTFNGANGDPFYNRYSSNYDTRDLKINTQSRTGSGTTPYETTFFQYDALDQLKQERVVGGVAGTPYTKDYNYDAMGNRTRVALSNTAANAITTSTPNDLNQLTSVSTAFAGGATTNAALTYDAAGNLTQSLDAANDRSVVYGYDDADRLSSIEWFDNSYAPKRRTWKSAFEYDYASRRVETREYSYANTPQNPLALQSLRFAVFDGLDVVQERDNNNRVTAQLVRDGNINGILSRTTASGAAYYGYDGNGNVTLLTDSAGQDVGHYRYDAFGQTLEAVGSRASENPYRFSTKPIHERSGLVDYGFRFYSPGMGRWMNRDPLQEEGGINLYGAMGNNAVNNVDEYGLTWLDDLVNGGKRWVNDQLFGKPKHYSSDEDGEIQRVADASAQVKQTGPKAAIVGMEVYMAVLPMPKARASTWVRKGGTRIRRASAPKPIRKAPVATNPITIAQLPQRGKVRYIPPINWKRGTRLPTGNRNGFVDKFGNEWTRGPSRTAGEAFEWDVQLAGRGNLHLNISLKGRITHGIRRW